MCRFRRAMPFVFVVFARAAFGTDGAPRFVDIVVPLQDSRFYGLREAQVAIRNATGAGRVVEAADDRRMEIRPLERAALLAAAECGLLEVRFEADRLRIRLPDPQDDAVRREQRRRLERWLGLPADEWPAGCGLHFPDRFDPAARTLLVVHGMEAGPTDLRRFQQACAAVGVQCLTYIYPNDGPPARAGDRLGEELGRLAAKHPGWRVAVAGHSLGGLVARHALERSARPPACVTDVFLLGTPHRGSAVCDVDVQQWLDLLFRLVPSDAPRPNLVEDGLGEAATDVRPGSAFLRSLDPRRRPRGIRYHAAAGRKGFLDERAMRTLAAEADAFLDRRGAGEDHRRRVREFLSADELRDGRGDGAVTVASALLAEADDRATFDANHVELLSLPGTHPERHAVFTWILATMKWETSHARD